MTDQEALNRDHEARLATLEQIQKDIRADLSAIELAFERLVTQVQTVKTALIVIAVTSTLGVDWTKVLGLIEKLGH